MDNARIAVMVGPKGRGSNMLALIRAGKEGRMPACVEVVIAPTHSAPAVQTAQDEKVRVAIVEPGDDYGARLLDAMEGCRYVCLAGFLRLLPEEVLRAFPDRVLNIHPALLPDFGGKGMYGARVHEGVIAAGAKESGCTVHLVNERYDDGRILLQKRLEVAPDDTPESLAARVLELEHQAYPEALTKLTRE